MELSWPMAGPFPSLMVPQIGFLQEPVFSALCDTMSGDDIKSLGLRDQFVSRSHFATLLVMRSQADDLTWLSLFSHLKIKSPWKTFRFILEYDCSPVTVPFVNMRQTPF